MFHFPLGQQHQQPETHSLKGGKETKKKQRCSDFFADNIVGQRGGVTLFTFVVTGTETTKNGTGYNDPPRNTPSKQGGGGTANWWQRVQRAGRWQCTARLVWEVHTYVSFFRKLGSGFKVNAAYGEGVNKMRVSRNKLPSGVPVRFRGRVTRAPQHRFSAASAPLLGPCIASCV